MNIRIPPSLSWLVKKYSYLIDELKKVELEKSDIEKRYCVLKADIEALKRVLSLHEITIDPKEIPATRKNRKITQLKHGELTKLIYESLTRTLSDNSYLTTTAVFEYIVAKKGLTFRSLREQKEYRNAVRKRLKDMAQSEKVVRKENRPWGHDASWRLN